MWCGLGKRGSQSWGTLHSAMRLILKCHHPLRSVVPGQGEPVMLERTTRGAPARMDRRHHASLSPATPTHGGCSVQSALLGIALPVS